MTPKNYLFLLLSAVQSFFCSLGHAYTFQVDIEPNNFVVDDSGTAPLSGTVMLGYFQAGTDFTKPFADLDSTFVAVAQGNVGAGGFQLSIPIPASGNWDNGKLDGNAFAPDWTSSAAQDAVWDSTFSGQQMILVFTDIAGPIGDGFTGTPKNTLFDTATMYLIVDSENKFDNSVASSLGYTFATVSSADPVLKTSGAAIILGPIPSPTKATFDFSAATYSGTEGGNVDVVITRSGDTSKAVSVNVTATDGTASQGLDFTFSPATQAVNFLATETSKTVTIPLPQRPGFQGGRTFSVTLSNPQAAADAELGTQTSATVTILEDDVAFGTVSFDAVQVASTISVNEGDGVGNTVVLNIVRTGGTDGAITVAFSSAPGAPGAVLGTDYTIDASPVVVAEGSSTQTITVTTIPNLTFEGNRTLTVTLDSASDELAGNALGSPVLATIEIVEDDAPPAAGTVRFNSATFSGPENGIVMISAIRENGSFGAATVDAVFTDGTGVSPGDYDSTTITFSWADGEAGIKSLQVPVVDNQNDEPDKSFNATLANQTGGITLVNPTTATITILDDDVAGALEFASATASVAENAGSLTLTVNRNGGSDGAVQVTVAATNGSATAGTDFTSPPTPLPFANGQTSANVVVPIADIPGFQGDRTFTVTLFAPTNGATLGATTSTTVTITDNEVPTPGEFVFDPASVLVSESAGTVNLTIKRVNGSDNAVTVDYATVAGTAQPGDDYTDPGTQTVAFAQGETSKQISIAIISDDIFENNETFSVVLSNPTNGASLGATATATVTIANDDQPVSFSLNNSEFEVNEGSSVTITVRRQGGSAGIPKQVRYSTASGSAIDDHDFKGVSGTLTFNNNGTQTVTIATINDTDPENAETFFFNLELVDPTDVSTRLTSPSTATIIIRRNAEGLDQPDVMAAQPATTKFAGNDTYNTSGNGQIAVQNTKSGNSVTFTIRAQNDSPIMDSIKLTGAGSGTAIGSTTTFRIGGEDITELLTTADGYVIENLRPGQYKDIRVTVKIKKGSDQFTGYGGTINATSVGTTSKTDTARVLVIVR